MNNLSEKVDKIALPILCLLILGFGIWIAVWSSYGAVIKIFGGIIVGAGFTLLLHEVVWRKSLRLKQVSTGLLILVVIVAIISSFMAGWPKLLIGIALTIFLIIILLAISTAKRKSLRG